MTVHPRPASPEVPCNVETDHPHGGESLEHCAVVNPGRGPGTDADRERPDVSGYRGNVGRSQRIPGGKRAAYTAGQP